MASWSNLDVNRVYIYQTIEPRNPNGELVELSLIVHRVHDFYVAKMQRQINKLR